MWLFLTCFGFSHFRPVWVPQPTISLISSHFIWVSWRLTSPLPSPISILSLLYLSTVYLLLIGFVVVCMCSDSLFCFSLQVMETWKTPKIHRPSFKWVLIQDPSRNLRPSWASPSSTDPTQSVGFASANLGFRSDEPSFLEMVEDEQVPEFVDWLAEHGSFFIACAL